MAYNIVIPKSLNKDFKEITELYDWFPEKLKNTLNQLKEDPTYGTIEFYRGYDCYGVLIAHLL